MTRTDEFAQDMRRELRELHPEIEWTCSSCPDDGNEHADLVGTPKRRNGKHILIEVELRRLCPVSNVVKVWRWVESREFKARPIVFQAFSRFYDAHGSHRKSAVFIGKQMTRACGVLYVAMDFEYNPRRGGKVGAGHRHDHAVNLARRISRRLKTKR
jgi:hypothetical protein